MEDFVLVEHLSDLSHSVSVGLFELVSFVTSCLVVGPSSEFDEGDERNLLDEPDQ